MFVEILSSAVAAGIVGLTTLKARSLTDDSKRIARICYHAGLKDKEHGGKPIRLLRKSKREWGMEYAFSLPMGHSFADFQAKHGAIEDGLNQRSYIDVKSFLRKLAKLKLGPNIVADLRKLINEKDGASKTVELLYNGVLLVRVYDVAMPDYFEFQQEYFDKLRGWEVLVGATKTKLVKHDFDKNVHLIVAGSAGGGKSVFLKNTITTLVARQTKNVNLFLIDLKGGICLNRFRTLEQVRGFARNPDEARLVLTRAQATMEKRLDYLLTHGYEDVKEAGFTERDFVVIDEAADVSGDRVCQEIIADIARRGRAAGFTLIYATQYPTNETLSSQVRQNVSAQVVYRLKTEVASRVALDEGGAEKLPLIKGRAIYRNDIKQIVQTPFMSNKFIDDTIKPHVIIRPRKEDDRRATYEDTAPRTSALILEETRLS